MLPSYIPWRRIDSWSCLACGECCRRFRPSLTAYEYALILDTFGPSYIGSSGLGKPCLRMVRGRCVFQNKAGLCSLQPLGMKPLACKLWPFRIKGKTARDTDEDEAIFQHKGQAYYVYVDPSCNGINQGDPRELPKVIHEVIEISKEPRKSQFHSTSRLLIPLLVL